MAADPQTKLVDFGCESAENWQLRSRELLDIIRARNLAYEETRALPGERDNARNNDRCTKARKATHGLDGQHQDVDRTLRGAANPRIEDG